MIATIQAFLNSCAVSFDLPILDWIQSTMQSAFMDKFMPFITLFGEAGIFWMVLSALFVLFPKTRKMGLGMAFAMVMGLIVCNMTLKPLIARPRPYDFQMTQFGRVIPLLIEAQHDFSFPSGHTLASFEAATVLAIHSKKAGIPALILASLIAFSRLYLYVHYPTDVLFSVAMGIGFGFLGAFLVKKGVALFEQKTGKTL